MDSSGAVIAIWQLNSDEFMAVILPWYVGQIKVAHVGRRFMSWRGSWPMQSLLQPSLYRMQL